MAHLCHVALQIGRGRFPRYLFAGSLRRIAELRPQLARSRIAVTRLIVLLRSITKGIALMIPIGTETDEKVK